MGHLRLEELHPTAEEGLGRGNVRPSRVVAGLRLHRQSSVRRLGGEVHVTEPDVVDQRVPVDPSREAPHVVSASPGGCMIQVRAVDVQGPRRADADESGVPAAASDLSQRDTVKLG